MLNSISIELSDWFAVQDARGESSCFRLSSFTWLGTFCPISCFFSFSSFTFLFQKITTNCKAHLMKFSFVSSLSHRFYHFCSEELLFFQQLIWFPYEFLEDFADFYQKFDKKNWAIRVSKAFAWYLVSSYLNAYSRLLIISWKRGYWATQKSCSLNWVNIYLTCSFSEIVVKVAFFFKLNSRKKRIADDLYKGTDFELIGKK